ncbi:MULTISPECIES: sugar porter family MFS transporter [Brachybacterium]|uniref:MFS transporter n=1 Tax=Brachybacterium alimentarium TaxID=47845 RepID=A0A2A3YGE2_9MICO|nr:MULTISPECIES: sugar porter family MFS transporter [Brachybacterium]PCC31841.1 MFS transporter [Brachybacterium alimentarium]PCC38309.1 MFS transporter [Brachybacterium alimentarium]RCS66834.1 MFS transporter [Brachybacterium sp. JB7]RCS71875.1 MFS transporter [Brachybacterium alimentarium]RCS74235.1 MFS transporter [Brachybacterium alimentarium]
MSSSATPADASAHQIQRLNPKVLVISIAAAIGGFLFGFDTSVINGAVNALSDEFALGAGLTGFAVSSALIGCAVGAWFAGALSNRYGRIPVMVIAAILFFASAIGSGLAFGVWDLIIWRVVGGLGVGAASVIAPAYIAEVAPAKFRGRLGSLQQLAIVLGIFTALLSNALLANTAGGAAESLWFGVDAWRWMFMIEAVPAAVYGIMALFLPESPRYLIGKGDLDKASRVLYDFTGEVDVNLKIQQIRRTLEREDKGSLRDLLGGRFGLKPIVWIGVLLSLFQQLVGINVIFYYSTTLWQSVGFDESQALLTSTITSVMNIVATIIAILLVDKVGRRLMLLVGSAGMTVSLGLMALAFSFGEIAPGADSITLPDPWSTVALVAANAFVMFFGTTWGPLVWVLLGEMFPNRIRASALAVAAAAQWAANWAVSATFPALSNIGLSFAYGLYAAFALISLLFVFLWVPETKNRELEDMDDLQLGHRKKDAEKTAPSTDGA